MKKRINIWCLSLLLLLVSACSEDVAPDSALAGPLYDLPKGEPGSVDALIYSLWERCGIYYLYDFNENAFRAPNWSGRFSGWYTPVKEENKEMIRHVVEVLHEEIFAGMEDDYVRRNWYVRVFLVDSLSKDSAFDPEDSDLIDNYYDNADMLIIPNIGNRMKAFTEEDWRNWKNSISSLFISRLYLGAVIQPVKFFDLRLKKSNGSDVTAIYANAWEKDPDGRYTDGVYTFRKNGYIKSKPDGWSSETILIVDRQQDIADYMNFLTTTTKEELDWNMSHFPKLLERTLAIEPYFKEVLGLDIVGMQNINCPDDPIPADYFKNLAE